MTTHRYFLYDPEGDGFSTYETVEERDRAAREAVPEYCDEAWREEVTEVVAGEITHVATEVNRVDRPSDDEIDVDGCDDEGYDWSTHDWYCDYVMKPIKEDSNATEDTDT